MSAIRMVIAGRAFDRKADVQKEERRIRYAAPLNTDLEPPERDFVVSLFEQLYPRDKWIQKGLHEGVKAVRVIFIMKSRCFSMLNRSGQWVEPSVRICFNPHLAGGRGKAISAFRTEISDQSLDYRDKYFKDSEQARCETSRVLVTRDTCQVDHAPPWTFQRILDAFVESQGLELENVETKDPSNGIGAVLSDQVLRFRWKFFHLEYASFRVVSNDEHARITREERKER